MMNTYKKLGVHLEDMLSKVNCAFTDTKNKRNGLHIPSCVFKMAFRRTERFC